MTSFYCQELLDSYPTPRLKNCNFSAICDGLFSIQVLTAIFHIWSVFSIHILGMSHDMETKDPLNTAVIQTLEELQCSLSKYELWKALNMVIMSITLFTEILRKQHKM
jgi:hypothetical protein